MSPDPLVLVIIPTVDGREEFLDDALLSHKGEGVVVRVEENWGSCGEAWNAGARLLDSIPEVTHIMFSADDLVAWKGWREAALGMCLHGDLPAPMLYGTNGLREQDHDGPPLAACAFSRIPFMPRELYVPCPPIHYYSDVWYGDLAASQNKTIKVCPGFCFTHRWAQAGRIHDYEPDRIRYEGTRP